MAKVLNGTSIPNIPWEEKPSNCKDVCWRSSLNPILTRDDIEDANSLFNSSVTAYKGEFRGVFRCDKTDMLPLLHKGKSKDGIHWDIDDEPLKFENEVEGQRYEYGYDPRICELEGKYYIIWCRNAYSGQWAEALGLAWTEDFEKFYLMENPFLPFNRNGSLFPRKINGYYTMLTRPMSPGNPRVGSIHCSVSKDLEFWGHHRFVMGPKGGWQSCKIGSGPTPIETDEGWLLIYHGVKSTCNGLCYYAGIAILDLEDPTKVLYRSKKYILSPREIYECVGDVPNVVFPCAALCDADTGRITIYYGAADTVVGMAHTTVDDLIEFAKKNTF